MVLFVFGLCSWICCAFLAFALSGGLFVGWFCAVLGFHVNSFAKLLEYRKVLFCGYWIKFCVLC